MELSYGLFWGLIGAAARPHDDPRGSRSWGNTLCGQRNASNQLHIAVTMGTPRSLDHALPSADMTRRLRYRASNTRINFLVATGLNLRMTSDPSASCLTPTWT